MSRPGAPIWLLDIDGVLNAVQAKPQPGYAAAERRSPYRPTYDDGRAKYAEAVHQVPCVRCGPKGKPALPGSPLSDGHKHARAMRLVMKHVLKDLWMESKRLYGSP